MQSSTVENRHKATAHFPIFDTEKFSKHYGRLVDIQCEVNLRKVPDGNDAAGMQYNCLQVGEAESVHDLRAPNWNKGKEGLGMDSDNL